MKYAFGRWNPGSSGEFETLAIHRENKIVGYFNRNGTFTSQVNYEYKLVDGQNQYVPNDELAKHTGKKFSGPMECLMFLNEEAS